MKVNVTGIKALFQDDVEFRKTSIRNFVMDQTNTYEDRLEIYLNTPPHLQYRDDYIFNHPTIHEDEWMQCDWWNRHEEIDLTDIPQYVKGWDEDEEKQKEWYLGCMNEGTWSFRFD